MQVVPYINIQSETWQITGLLVGGTKPAGGAETVGAEPKGPSRGAEPGPRLTKAEPKPAVEKNISAETSLFYKNLIGKEPILPSIDISS